MMSDTTIIDNSTIIYRKGERLSCRIDSAPCVAYCLACLDIRIDGFKKTNDTREWVSFLVDNLGRIFVFDGDEHDYLNDPDHLILVPWPVLKAYCDRRLGLNPKTLHKAIRKTAKTIRENSHKYWYQFEGPAGFEFDSLHGEIPIGTCTNIYGNFVGV